MQETENKTSNFLKAINKYAREQRQELKTELERFKKYELEKAEAEVLRDAYHLIQREMNQMKKGISSEVSREEMICKKLMFQKRNDIKKKVFESVEKRLINFTDTERYTELMVDYAKAISKVLNKPGTTLYVCSRDLRLSQELKDAFGAQCSVEPSSDIKIGGILGMNSSMGIIADETIDSKLEDQSQWFDENSGLSVV